MVKYTVWNDKFNRENTKFRRELNTYGVDENGIGEELLFPIRLNDESGGIQETTLATYLIKYKEFERTDVKITKDQDKEGFLKSLSTDLSLIFGGLEIRNSRLFLTPNYFFSQIEE